MVGIKHLALFFGAAWALPLTENANSKRGAETIPGKYIVTFKPGTEAAAVQSHLAWVSDVHARSLSRRDTTGVNKVFDIQDFSAYSGSFDDATLEQIRNSEQVAAVEPDMVWTLNAMTTEVDAPWGLGSVSHKTPNSTEYVYDTAAGEGTFAYLIDTGLLTTHVEFEGRAFLGYNAYPDSDFVDHIGHGTHTAGTIGSRAYGVAKKATLISVKVFDWGSSSTEIVLDGYTWAVNNITNTTGRAAKSVISMSLGGPRSDAFNAAVAAAYKAGVLTVVAAGNDGEDAKDTSPASAREALTVGAIDVTNTMAYFSNFGRSVDLFAPGVDVLSCWIDSDTATAELDGTSMATPHVAGLALYLKSLYPSKLAGAGATARHIKDLGTKGVVQELAPSTVNLIAYNGNGA